MTTLRPSGFYLDQTVARHGPWSRSEKAGPRLFGSGPILLPFRNSGFRRDCSSAGPGDYYKACLFIATRIKVMRHGILQSFSAVVSPPLVLFINCLLLSCVSSSFRYSYFVSFSHLRTEDRRCILMYCVCVLRCMVATSLIRSTF